MTDLQDQLAQIRERVEESGGSDQVVWIAMSKNRDIAERVLDSQADVPRLVEAVEVVMEKASYMTRYAHGQDYWGGVRAASQEILAALNDKLTGEDDGRTD